MVVRNKASLQRHVLTAHRPQQQYQCSECGATYKSKSALRKHEVYHSKNLKWHRCSAKGCRKRFKRAYELMVHERGFHSKAEDRIECPRCGEVFKNIYSLSGHIANAHPRPEGYACSLSAITWRGVGRVFVSVSDVPTTMQRRVPRAGAGLAAAIVP